MANYKLASIVGSLRKDSINRKIARSICALRGDNLDCSMVEIGDLPLYNQDYALQRQQPEAYLGHVSEDSFDEDGRLKEGPLGDLVGKLAHAFHDWVETILRARELLEHDAARAERANKKLQNA